MHLNRIQYHINFDIFIILYFFKLSDELRPFPVMSIQRLFIDVKYCRGTIFGNDQDSARLSKLVLVNI